MNKMPERIHCRLCFKKFTKRGMRRHENNCKRKLNVKNKEKAIGDASQLGKKLFDHYKEKKE
ncbi:hypothetical protein LCGC14_0176190 [marine sediment metagenome]|uniref:Uncharacterized protein n=1 Tax=marine sediment metagenome TaxID=412755 RepID=A0A0F9URH4_9ZZZZ